MTTPNRKFDTAEGWGAVVHVVDDDVSPREALELLMSSIGLAVRTYASVKEFLEAGPHRRPGCIVLDVRLPGISGLDFQARCAEYDIQLPIIFMTGHSDVPMTVRAMKAGAVDFLPKPFRDQDMIDAVTAAVERDRERREAESASRSVHARYANLSLREQQVMCLVARGKMNKEVAYALGLSIVTVKAYRGAVMRKMGAQTFADLVRIADAVGERHLSNALAECHSLRPRSTALLSARSNRICDTSRR
jgi:FixJ family two-component response regulator